MIPIDLDIDMLRCFIEVARTGSFTRAGKNIHLTQSGVSVKIRRLEERLGKQVFNREGKRLLVTPDGEILRDYANKILDVHDEAVSRLNKAEISGKLKVGIIDYFIPGFLPNILSKFRKQYPNIELEIQIRFGSNLVPMFEKGELDLIVVGKESYQGDSQILTREPLLWVIGDHADIPLEKDIIGLVLFPAPCNFRKMALAGLEAIKRKWNILFTGTSIASVQAALQAGMGLSILPKGALKEGIREVPASLNLPELPTYSVISIVDEQKANIARDIFASYLEAEVDNLG